MLVLSRQQEETIEIKVPTGDGRRRTVEIRVTDIRGDKVRLGISADRDVEIDRGEVARAKERASGNTIPPVPMSWPGPSPCRCGPTRLAGVRPR